MEPLTLEARGGSSQNNEAVRQPEQLPPGMPNSGNGQKKRKRDWEERKTSILLECLKLPQFRNQKRKKIITKWDDIAEDIQRKLGADPAMTGKRCMQRWGTLMGCHRKTKSAWEDVKKDKGNLAEDEWGNLRDSMGLSEDWYQAIGEVITGPRQGKPRSRKDCNHLQEVTTDGPSSSCVPTVDGSSEPVQIERPGAGRSSNKQIAIPGFNTMNDWQRSTLLDLIFAAYIYQERSEELEEGWDYELLSSICEWLAIVQKRDCLAVYDDVIALEKMGLLSTSLCFRYEVFDVGNDKSEPRMNYSLLRVYRKFYKKVMKKNPDYDTRLRMQHKSMVTFDVGSAWAGITVLDLHGCEELEVVNLGHFPKLRSLSIWTCPQLRVMSGWECLEELGWLEVCYCLSYRTYPPFQNIPSLQVLRFREDGYRGDRSLDVPRREVDLSGCVRLRRLEIIGVDALSCIRGLDELRSLTVLTFNDCEALQNLPDIGHMKDLIDLNISSTGVEEIKGVEKLSSLKYLYCMHSKLKTLPDLSHLSQLQSVDLWRCPVVKDPSSPYFGQDEVRFNGEEKHVDVSDISDNEHDVSDEEM